MITLRTYQEQAIQSARTLIGRGVRRVMLNAPTGAGKTVIAAGIVQRSVDKGKRVLFLAHRRELIDQTVDKLVAGGVLNFGVIMAGSKLHNRNAPVQVASIQTLMKRELPEADLIMIDEAHRAASKSYITMVGNYPGAAVIGLSATPERLDGKGLDDIFQELVVVESVPALIEAGFLVKPICYVGPTADLSAVKTRRGDYDEKQLADAVDRPQLVGDIVANWHRLAKGKQTVAFAASVEHAKHIADEFFAAGIPAAMISGNTPVAERNAIIADWRAGAIKVVANCLVLTEGFDYPELECCILARPTKSVSMYLQCVGRVMRTAEGKVGAIVLDHAGCCKEHGQPHIDRVWSLEGMAKKRKGKDDDAANLTVCDACAMVYDPEPKLWLSDTQPKLLDHLKDGATKIIQGKAADRTLSTCPGCSAATCLICNTPFKPTMGERDIDGIATEKYCLCPSCHAHYVDDVPHIATEPTEQGLPETTDDALVAMADDEIPVKVTVLNEYKRLINEARVNGRKRGWAYWRMREKWDEETLRECLPRHTGGWWKAKA
jgi:superfamily II DNA or RNA helicase